MGRAEKQKVSAPHLTTLHQLRGNEKAWSGGGSHAAPMRVGCWSPHTTEPRLSAKRGRRAGEVLRRGEGVKLLESVAMAQLDIRRRRHENASWGIWEVDRSHVVL